MANWTSFSNAIVNELTLRLDEVDFIPDTLYIGGGTPSLMPAGMLESLIFEIERILDKKDRWIELTLEVNPEDVDDSNCMIWKTAGVSRVSMGIQSLISDELKIIGRKHSPEDAITAYKVLERYFDNINIDVMFGLPNQTYESFSTTLDKIFELSPAHLSAYSLMLEENTPLTILHSKGRIKLPDEESSMMMWDTLTSRSRKNGYVRYEISNYSRPEFRSLHNSRYWTGNPYLGLGPSAHSYDGEITRKYNPNDIKGYIDFFSEKKYMKVQEPEVFYKTEKLSREELIEEMIMLGLRTKEGIDLNRATERFGDNLSANILYNAQKDLKAGNLVMEGSQLFLSDNGIMLSDDVILRLSMFL